MMNLSTFQAYLTSKAPLPSPSRTYLNGEEEQLLKWSASLSMQSEDVQVSQLEKVLIELSVSKIADELRLRLMHTVTTAMDRLVAMLRQRYVHESGALSDEHLHTISQVKSLYYLNVLVYDAIVRREKMLLNYQQNKKAANVNAWKRFVKPTPILPYTLGIAIYQSLLTYQKLLYEEAICYQNTPAYIWQALNQLYHLACEHDIAHTDLTQRMVARQAGNIHQLYCQLCLHSLLNVSVMPRSGVLLVQRFIPEWTTYIIATLEPQTQTRIFVNLNGDRPPEYLTASTAINPYEEQQNCLFIEIQPLANHLQQRQSVLAVKDNETTESRLVTEILTVITYRYLSRQTTSPPKNMAKKRALVTIGFNDIHYRVAGECSLMNLIAAKELSFDHLPRYDTARRKDAMPLTFAMEMHDYTSTMPHFRTLCLLTAKDFAAKQVLAAFNSQHQSTTKPQRQHDKLTDIFKPLVTENVNKTTDSVPAAEDSDTTSTTLIAAPLRLKMMSLFLLNNPRQDAQDSWLLGVVRWLSVDDDHVEAEGQILAHKLTACALRLDSVDSRSQYFVPALLIDGEETLQSTSSLLVPSYHFKAKDKVVIRLNNQQQYLRLQHSLLSTDEFTQYEVVRL